MKVYTCPPSLPAPTIDYRNYDSAKEIAAEQEHSNKLKTWLKLNGCTGKYTGEIFSAGVADGCAQYMLADGRKSCLIHLPYGDAYQYRDVEFLPKKEIIRRIEADKKITALFSGRA